MIRASRPQRRFEGEGTTDIDSLLAELSMLLARYERVKAMGIRPQAVRQAVLDVIDEVYELVNEEEL